MKSYHSISCSFWIFKHKQQIWNTRTRMKYSLSYYEPAWEAPQSKPLLDSSLKSRKTIICHKEFDLFPTRLQYAMRPIFDQIHIYSETHFYCKVLFPRRSHLWIDTSTPGVCCFKPRRIYRLLAIHFDVYLRYFSHHSTHSKTISNWVFLHIKHLKNEFSKTFHISYSPRNLQSLQKRFV